MLTGAVFFCQGKQANIPSLKTTQVHTHTHTRAKPIMLKTLTTMLCLTAHRICHLCSWICQFCSFIKQHVAETERFSLGNSRTLFNCVTDLGYVEQEGHLLWRLWSVDRFIINKRLHVYLDSCGACNWSNSGWTAHSLPVLVLPALEGTLFTCSLSVSDVLERVAIVELFTMRHTWLDIQQL